MEENKFIHALRKHWSKLLLGVLALACIGAWAERFYKANQVQSKQDFFMANQIFEQFYTGQTLAAESIEAAENILERHPELHPKYDSMLALTFFSQSKTPKAIQYARSLIDHTDKQLPEYYKDFASASLLISEKNFEEAFASALELDQKLSNQPDYQALEAMNTLRLLFLANTLGFEADKQVFWEKLEKQPEYVSIQSLFQEGGVSLRNFFNVDPSLTNP